MVSTRKKEYPMNAVDVHDNPAEDSDNNLGMEEGEKASVTKNVVILVSLLCCSFGLLYSWSRNLPILPGGECSSVSATSIIQGALHRDVSAIRSVWMCMEAYKQDYYWLLMTGFILTYVTFQMFAIPGPVILSLLSGALWGKWTGQLVVCVCATGGASAAYFMSHYLGKPILWKMCPEMLKTFSKKVDANKGNLFWYMLFLRISPILPNWFINVSSPIVNVPISTFAIGTAIGLIPNNYLYATMGLTIADATNANLSQSWHAPVMLLFLGVLVLLPTLFKGKLEQMEAEKFAVKDVTKKR